MCQLYQNSLKRGFHAHCSRAQAMLPLAAFCNALRATCNTVRSLTLASNVCMVGLAPCFLSDFLLAVSLPVLLNPVSRNESLT